ncbi:putative phosphatidylglycerol phosphatidylinositol transfer protein [Phaeomoniella chlamydospora]|uniref:Phosphatidylglycerol/phosphatidylinositol transfer protein n=1 Tax=Phaeomoniella chlamydospora TaxID=158046 RepID=A0A0G2EP65_PHACM|nr:putative phosphatidylglycerol phosphatidylinositol transfer protein [Phaeomoniella chlamydospora]
MKFASVIVPFAYFSLATSLSLLGSDQAALNEGNEALKVPGENPLTYCADPSDYILSIDYADLDPNPPKAGETLTISASGTFSKDVEEGTKVLLQVKYGLITLIKQEADLCEQIGNVDLECPLKKGPMTLTKEVQIPKEVPKGKYTVMADVYTESGEKVTCLNAITYF